MLTTRLRVTRSKAVSQFIKCLSRDIRPLGHRLVAQSKGRAIHLSLRQARAVDFGAVNARLYCRALWTSRKEIREIERRNLGRLALGDPDLIQVGRIEPHLVVCEDASELALFDYLRRFQTVISNPCVGAQIKGIIYDLGHANAPAIMGILAISSAMYFQGARDKYLGWENPKAGATARAIREVGLKRCLQLSICMAIPPYDALRCGRLVAMLALSELVQSAYARKYGESLLALTVTAGLRNYGVLYDRVHLARLKDGADKAHLYVKLPQSGRKRYFLSALSPETWAAAEQVTRAVTSQVTRAVTSASKRQACLLRALRACGLPDSLLLANDTATYLGSCSARYIDCLKSGQSPDLVEALTLDKILEYWRERFVDGAEQRLRAGTVRKGALLSARIKRPRA